MNLILFLLTYNPPMTSLMDFNNIYIKGFKVNDVRR